MLKGPLKIEQQIDRLIEHGYIINDRSFAATVLKNINYYRFTGYALQFRIEPSNSDLSTPISFEQILDIYNFDAALRNLLLKYLEKTEIYYRTKIAYIFSTTRCMEPPHDQHYYESNFYMKDAFLSLKESLSNNKARRYADDIVILHHNKKYNAKMPLWVIVEYMSYTSLSKLYSVMYYTDQETIANAIGTTKEILKNRLHCLSVLRNKCAHGARLYNVKYSPKPKLKTSLLRRLHDMETDSLFAYLIMLFYALPDMETSQNYKRELLDLLYSYEEKVDYRGTGFPISWKETIGKL